MGRRRYIVWSVFFGLVTVLLGVLATGWNYTIIKMADHISSTGPVRNLPWYWLIVGSIGSCAVLAGLIVFFVRLMREIRKNQMQSEYLARITHELKTPLATLELSSSLLKASGLEPEEADQLWQSHQRELNRLKSNVESLLLAARFDAKLFKPQSETFLLEDWINKEWIHWQTLLGSGALIKRTGMALDGPVFGDPHFLRLITDNVIENARKYSKDTPQICIHTHMLSRGSRRAWQIQFEDFGLGFDPALKKKIFKPFVRAVASRQKSIPGTGLGLYLARSAARKMGYHLHAESKGVGQGARFILEGNWA